MMSERLKNVVGDFIEDLLREPMTAAEQTRFAGIMERMFASDSPADQWLSSAIMMQICDKAEAEYQAEQEGRIYSIYALGRVGETAAFYIGASKDVQARYAAHLETARYASGSNGQLPVTVRIRAEMPPNGPGVWCETLLPNLTLETAKSLEGSLVSELVRNGADLTNGNLLGKHGPANRHPPGTPEFDEAQREYMRQLRSTPEGLEQCREASRRCRSTPEGLEQSRNASRRGQRKRYATPEGRTRSLASRALNDLKNGRPLTPMRRQHLEDAGRVENARAILAARGESWPGDERA